MIHPKDSKGLGLMNPSILLDQTKILLNLRNINYTLYHCEGQQLLNGRWGPLSYLHPENDMHLRTQNFMCELDPESLEIKDYWLTDTSTYDVPPLWDFVGLEDARLVRWEGKLFQCGVRRDTTPNGVGRMELSEIVEIENPEPGKSKYIEVTRSRIEPPSNPDSYCEKNWVPVLDMPYHFIKWTNPTEVVKVNTVTGKSQTVFLGKSHIEGVPDFRGGTQVISWRNYRLTIVHEVNLFNNKLSQKDATYTHRFVVWDKDWNIIKISDSFSFMDGEIEFVCGLATYKKDFLVTFGFQDNAAFLLRIPEAMIEELIGIKKTAFDWGDMSQDLKNVVNQEIFINDTYQKFFKVENGDIVLDLGASTGPFTYSIMNKKPKYVFAIEPSYLFKTLLKNTKKNNSVICINKGISDKNSYKIFNEMWGGSDLAEGITFKKLLSSYNIPKIDFLKTDCEGGEYDVFNAENFEWVIQNVKKIAGEWHLCTPELKEKFKTFRDTYLKTFKKFEVVSLDGVDIKWDLWNDSFINSYNEVMIYIDNRPEVKTEEKAPLIIKRLNLEAIKGKPDPKPEVKPTAKWQTAKWPTFEITTNILTKGCTMQCVFCPQQTILGSYKGVNLLSLDDFKKAIDKIPKEIAIIFSGFSEPFLNKKCADMILYAHEKGHAISIFTTGVGMTIEDFDKIKHIPFSGGPVEPLVGYLGHPINNGGFTLHLPDNELYAKHPITDKYIKLLEHTKSNEATLSNFHLTCMGTVHDKVKHIFPFSPNIDVWARANNLLTEQKLRPEIINVIKGKYKSAYRGENPVTCACDEKLYHNVLLPNGDVALCCMDYSLEHILGNLFIQEYNDIIPEPETKFNLCRFCENGAQPK